MAFLAGESLKSAAVRRNHILILKIFAQPGQAMIERPLFIGGGPLVNEREFMRIKVEDIDPSTRRDAGGGQPGIGVQRLIIGISGLAELIPKFEQTVGQNSFGRKAVEGPM